MLFYRDFFCYSSGMLSWDIVLGLVILSFALPFIFLSSRMKSTRYRAQLVHHETKHLRAMLNELEDHVRHDQTLFLEALGVPFLLMRSSGRVVMANKKAAELVGMEQLVHANLLRLLPDSELKNFLQQACSCSEFSRTNISVNRGKEQRIYRAKATPLANRERHIGIVFLDITEEQRTQIIRRDFVANASHELRTPLTLIMGYLDTLIDDTEAAEDAVIRQRSLGIMKRNADRMTRLISDMLTLSRVDSPDSGYLKHENFDLRQLAEDVCLRLKSMIDEQQATVKLDISPHPFDMQGDSFYWSQVIFNLMENALKNNPSPGLNVSLTATRKDDKSITIKVEDNGIGIPPDSLPYIFNRFYRADATGKVKGTGLGLAIVRHAVEAHGGTISAESTPEHHTTFTIHLPSSAK